MPERFYSAVSLATNHGEVELPAEEAHHLGQVLRGGVGDEVVVFDGQGHDWQARVIHCHKQRATVELLRPLPPLPEPRVPLTIAVALPKGDRQKWLIEKLVELGVREFVPLITERGVAQPVDSAVERLRRQVLEATKQCGRSWLMQIAPPQTVSEFLAVKEQSVDSRALFCMAQPQSAPESEELAAWAATPTGQTLPPLEQIWLPAAVFQVAEAWSRRTVLVGPEGGFTLAEVRPAALSGWRLMDLCPQMLRVETAAIVLASWALGGNC
ncbi:MAG: RsmE family RNA methyltransferase [Pirellulales bacterium]|nr:RsmE family RNA methyltransferase [Pirellulales bacterium]